MCYTLFRGSGNCSLLCVVGVLIGAGESDPELLFIIHGQFLRLCLPVPQVHLLSVWFLGHTQSCSGFILASVLRSLTPSEAQGTTCVVGNPTQFDCMQCKHSAHCIMTLVFPGVCVFISLFCYW